MAGLVLVATVWAGQDDGAPATEDQAVVGEQDLSDGTDDLETDGPEEEAAPPGRTHYRGREIAQTMHYTGAPWLIRESREREEGCSLMLKNLGIKPGMTVCDMGCGNGFYTVQMARLVGEQGKVLAVDIQPEMLRLLTLRAKKANLADRVQPILGSLWDPQLPQGEIDIILCADVYHEFSHPELMLAAMRASLADGGKIVLLEFREEDPKVPIKPLHKMSKRQVLKELKPNGFRLVREFDALPWQHMMFFEKNDAGGDKKNASDGPSTDTTDDS